MLPDTVVEENGRPLVWAIVVNGDYVPYALRFTDGVVIRVKRACRNDGVEYLSNGRRGVGAAKRWFLVEAYPGPAALATPAGEHKVIVYAVHRAEPDALAGDEGYHRVKHVRVLPLDALRLYDEIEIGECEWAPEGW